MSAPALAGACHLSDQAAQLAQQATWRHARNPAVEPDREGPAEALPQKWRSPFQGAVADDAGCSLGVQLAQSHSGLVQLSQQAPHQHEGASSLSRSDDRQMMQESHPFSGLAAEASSCGGSPATTGHSDVYDMPRLKGGSRASGAAGQELGPGQVGQLPGGFLPEFEGLLGAEMGPELPALGPHDGGILPLDQPLGHQPAAPTGASQAMLIPCDVLCTTDPQA